jgi:Leucine-rich repeat (LRR) protein
MGKLILSRYNPATNFLDLERFVFSTEFKDMGSKGFNQDPKTTKFGSVLCKLISQSCPNVETISFAGNKIESLLYFDNLSTFLPNIKNLSFKDNNLKYYDDLKGIQGSKFTELRELILAGTPSFG